MTRSEQEEAIRSLIEHDFWEGVRYALCTQRSALAKRTATNHYASLEDLAAEQERYRMLNLAIEDPVRFFLGTG